MNENQIVIENPVSDVVNGIIWEYSLDNATWQESPVFDDYNGQPFVSGQTYPVYAVTGRGTADEYRINGTYTFGLTNGKVTLDVAAKNGRRTGEVIDAFGFEAPEFEEVTTEVDFVLTEKLVITDGIPRKRIQKQKKSKLLDFPAVTAFMEGDEVIISRNEGGIRKSYRIPPDLLAGWTGGSAVPTPPTGGILTQTLTVGTAYIYELVAWSNANEYEVKDLPAGLVFNNATRRIYGTPTTSGNYVVTVTGISAAGIRKAITVGFTVQSASISRYLEELAGQRTGTSLKWTLKGEGGPEGIRIKQGLAGSGFTDASFFDMVKVADRTYEFTFQGAVDGDYTVRAELKVGSGAIQEDFTLATGTQPGVVFPGQVNLFTGKTAQVSSGSNQENINNLNLGDSFATDSELQPCIGFAGLETDGQKARHRVSYIHTANPADFQGAFVIAGENLSISAGSFQQNFNKAGIRFWQIPVDATSPIKIDLEDFQASTILVQRSDTGQLRLNEWQDFGDYPVINHPPVISTITDIVRTEGQSLDYDLNPSVTDVDGDAVTKVLTLQGGFALPSWMAWSGGHILVSALPWEGGSLSTVFEYPLQLTATDEHGSSTTATFKLKVQRVGTLNTLLFAKIHYDYIQPQRRLVITANVVDSGPMRVNLLGASGTVYGGSGWKVMANGSYSDDGTNKVLNAASPEGFSGVQPGDYEIQFQEVEGGPIISRAVNIPSENINTRTIYEKSDSGTPNPSISSISHTIDSNGKPIVNAVVFNAPNGVEVAIVQTSGGGWNLTSYGSAPLVSGNSSYQRAYSTVAPAGSYRYDVRIVGTSIVQSGVFTVAAQAVSNYFLQVDWADGGEGYLDVRAQVTDLTGVRYKFSTETSWKNAIYNSGMTNLLAGAKGYQLEDPLPTSTAQRTLQFQKTGTDQVLNVIIPAGAPPQDGQWHAIYTVELLVKLGRFNYDVNNKSFSTFFEPQTAGKALQIWLEAESGADENGSNFGSGPGSGSWQSEVWYDLVSNTVDVNLAGTSIHRRWEATGGTGVNQIPHRIFIREKNTLGPVQTITFTPPSSNTPNGGTAFTISAASGGTGGGTTPTPIVGAKIMLLGDSLMVDNVMRKNLKAGLDNAGIVSSLVGSLGSGTVDDPRHEGHVGYTIAQIRDGVAGWINAANPDIIVLMIGTNNVNNGAYNLSNAAGELGNLIDTIYATKSNVKLIVSNIPPRSDDTFNARVNTYNDIVPTVVAGRAANGRVLQYVGAASSLNRATDLSDGTHLNATGSGKLANGFLAGIQSLGPLVPGVSARLAPIREVYAVKHHVSYAGEMLDLKDELGVGFDEGLLTGAKLSVYYQDIKNPAAWAAFKNVYHWITVVKGKKCAIHMGMMFDKGHAMPSSVNDSTSEIYTNNGGTEQYYYTPSMSQNDGFLAWRNTGDTTNWQAGVTPKRILYDEMVIPAIQELEAIAPIWFLAQGRTHTGEGGYNSRVDSLEDAKFGGNEQSERDAFKAWLYTLGGGTLAGVRNLLGNQSLTDAQLVFPTPSRSSWESFWSTFKGTGIRQAWYEFRSRRVEQDQKMFEWYCRQTNPNIPVAFECGSFYGNQAVINGTTEVQTIASTADMVKENPTYGDNWEQKADVGRGLKNRFTGDADGSLRRENGMWATGGYTSPGVYTDREIARDKMVKMLNGNGYLGVFGNIRFFYYPLRLIKNDRTVAPAGLIGSDFVTIYNTKTLTYSSEEYRDTGSAKSLNNYTGPFTHIIQVNSPWPLAA
ncbi:putative Ig domain-containing protein [Larkinella humicola]|uniref:Dystroglycan-type cadherin-like domain-containing protein n=1 Tax=Larkinella humicola TaxID=2607654 RepID=A0A5N1JSF4_9BACT|nr:putative Ig domain-containing protein [Larkinella humicola]KAA9357242.1 hypothetical protein F0P93_05760 [Larkinella humicola]